VAGDEQIVALRCRPLTTWSATAGPSGAPWFHKHERQGQGAGRARARDCVRRTSRDW